MKISFNLLDGENLSETWQGRYKEILDVIDYIDKCDYHMNNDPERCADDLYELGVKLRKRKHMIERFLDENGTDLY